MAGININLHSLGNTEAEARLAWVEDPGYVRKLAAKNQRALEHALGTLDHNGAAVPANDRRLDFDVVIGRGYFPILGDLVIPAGAGRVCGQGGFVRRKSVANSENRAASLVGITDHLTALCPIGGSDANGILTQCGSSSLKNFTVSGCLKDPGDGGNGVILGHTPPLELPKGAAGPAINAASNSAFWAYRGNDVITQKRFVEPRVWSTDLTVGNESGRARLVDLAWESFDAEGRTEITIPAGAPECYPSEYVRDESIDIPLVRWVRVFNVAGEEIIRYSNAGESVIKGARVASGHNGASRRTTGRPKLENEARAYHLAAPAGGDLVVVLPETLPEDAAAFEVSAYHLKEFKTLTSQMTPFLPGGFYAYARASYNDLSAVCVDGMPWNGFVGVDGAYNMHRGLMARRCGLDGFYFPGGYEDYMHNHFISCGAVQNGGWGVYLAEPIKCSRSSLDANQWPNANGVLKAHTKFTYTPSSNDLGNFDCYGNTGGAYYFGASSNTLTTGAMENHFDSNQRDPFHPTHALTADWNPARWSALVVFAADATQNNINVVSTPTDSRRVLFCKARIDEETPAPTNPNSNHYSAFGANHYRHPRPDSLGSLVDVRPPSLAHLHLASYFEHEREGGDIPAASGGVGELQFCASGQNSFLARPWFYDRTPEDDHANAEWLFEFSARNEKLPSAAKEVTLSADLLGISGEGRIEHLHYMPLRWTFRGSEKATVIQPGRVLVLESVVSFFDGLRALSEYVDDARFESFDFKNVSVVITYLHDGVSLNAPQLPAEVAILPARVELFKHQTSFSDNAPKRVKVLIPLLNTGDTSVDLTDQSHEFKIKFEVGRE